MKELLNKLFVAPTTNIWLQLLRYGFVGGVAFVADYGTLFLLTHYAHVHYLVSAAVAFGIGLTVNYLLSISWVFNKNRSAKPWVEFLVFALIGVVGLGLNELIMYVATDLMSLHYMLSKLISTAIVFCWNFFARKLIIFK
jgi:putative flippase GtrA